MIKSNKFLLEFLTQLVNTSLQHCQVRVGSFFEILTSFKAVDGLLL